MRTHTHTHTLRSNPHYFRIRFDLVWISYILQLCVIRIAMNQVTSAQMSLKSHKHHWREIMYIVYERLPGSPNQKLCTVPGNRVCHLVMLKVINWYVLICLFLFLGLYGYTDRWEIKGEPLQIHTHTDTPTSSSSQPHIMVHPGKPYRLQPNYMTSHMLLLPWLHSPVPLCPLD